MMMRRLAMLLLSVYILGSMPPTASAYELRTHGLLTEMAFGLSAGTHEYLRAVGLSPARVLDPAAITRADLLAQFINAGTPLGWLIEGAIREDDYKTSLQIAGCEPPRNPPSAIDRVRHHFYDPDTGQGMRFAIFTGLPAPDWALGDRGRGPGPEDNRFSWLDARLYQLRSLTEETPEERDRFAALLFRSLGQVVHMVQDMAQPQHTRNDIHPTCENIASGHIIPEHSWYEHYLEARALGRSFRGRPTSPLQLTNDPVPTLITPRSYFTHDNGRSGLAQFSSHNFFSAGTNLDRLCAGRERPPCRADAYRAVDVPHAVVTVLGVRLEAPVRLLLHTAEDPIAGRPSIPDIAITSRSVWSQHLERRGLLPTYSMNVLNYDSIGDVLLPRAVGYSAGLLDHFFSGRLEASVQPAGGDDPDVLKLVARNDSADAVEGVLLIHAEDPLTGQRRGVLADSGPLPLGAVPTGVVLGGASFPEVQFRAPFETEKYVVVYHGQRLGPERLEQPPDGAIGAVMAQVLGGPRAEALVPQGDRLLLRAVPGAFELPSSTDGLRLIQWSDVDNHFVGLATSPLPTGHPAPEEIRLFRLERPAGSVAVPLVPGSDPPLVDASLVRSVPFPYGLTLPTTVDYTRRVRVRQPLVTFPRTLTLHWQEASQAYETVGDVVGPATLEVPVDETVTFAEGFPIVLDRARLFGATASAPRPYSWRVLEVGHDARERLLALVQVQLTQPQDAQRSVALRAHSADCSQLEPRTLLPIAGGFRGETMLAVIDVDRGEVLGLTAAPLYAPRSTELRPVSPLLQERQIVTHVGGPQAGTETRCVDRQFLSHNPDGDLDVMSEVTLPHTGVIEFAVPGLYRGDLETLAGVPTDIVAGANEFLLVYAVVDEIQKAVRVMSTSSVLSGQLLLLREGLRMRPGPRAGSEILLRLERPVLFTGTHTVLVRWDPEAVSGARAALPGGLDPGRYRLLHATPEAAMLTVEEEIDGEQRTVLADLAAGTLIAHDGDLSSEFVLLPPGALYNVAVTRFYTSDTLDETALPLPLAPGPVSPLAAYHLIVRD
jgi:hypothetical protein